MVKKVVKKSESLGEGLGISGFTLGVLSILMAGTGGIMMSIVGFFFCLVQQKKAPTKLGKIGLILNVIGFVLGVLLVVLFVTKLAPMMQQQGYF